MMASAEEMAAVRAFFHAELSLLDTWVDGSDAQEEDVWRTSDGEVMTYLAGLLGNRMVVQVKTAETFMLERW